MHAGETARVLSPPGAPSTGPTAPRPPPRGTNEDTEPHERNSFATVPLLRSREDSDGAAGLWPRCLHGAQWPWPTPTGGHCLPGPPQCPLPPLLHLCWRSCPSRQCPLTRPLSSTSVGAAVLPRYILEAYRKVNIQDPPFLPGHRTCLSSANLPGLRLPPFSRD